MRTAACASARPAAEPPARDWPAPAPSRLRSDVCARAGRPVAGAACLDGTIPSRLPCARRRRQQRGVFGIDRPHAELTRSGLDHGRLAGAAELDPQPVALGLALARKLLRGLQVCEQLTRAMLRGHE